MKDRIPKHRKITYANFICNIRPQKSETHLVRLTAGGNNLDYPGDPWTRSLANEFGRLCTGIGKTRPKAELIEGTVTMFFTTKDKIPRDRKITYTNFI